jgi:hypothetical protein
MVSLIAEMFTSTNADACGEMLRALVFPGPGFGCYESFDVRDGAESWDDARLNSFWDGHLGADPLWAFTEDELAGLASGHTITIGALRVDVSWLWDGDGTLCFRVWDGDIPVRGLYNTDCKKDYDWKDWPVG